ncbi:major facilitator superfamily domain-containing protein [Pisolithus marmoratus]|nr:major facilitator superfamily domain-containing protein [Pisolithus marmoratus]
MVDTEHGHPPARAALEDYERDSGDKPPFVLTFAEVKLLGIAGVGFFLDAYDLFIINPVSTMLQYRLYGGNSLPNNLQGVLKASANIGSVVGQFLFGYMADALGRKAIYGKELMLIIFATIMCISCPTNDLSSDGALIWLTVFRVILGIGVGGDYPMSASVASDRAVIRKRGTLLAYIFANQGWGSLVGSLATIIVLACYKHVMNDEGETSKVDGVWRIVVGLSLIPAFGTLYQRLTLPEAERYKRAKRGTITETDDIKEIKDVKVSSLNESDEDTHADIQQKAHFGEFIEYFSEWRHAKILIGTCTCWFLLDIAFYGINLNQNVVLQTIGYDGKTGTAWEKLFKISTGNIIITALGFVPGMANVFSAGRSFKFKGFLMTALFLGILAGKFTSLNNASFIVCFALLQFFFNFGPNATTYCYPAEVFPTKYRASAHGVSAACGKAGAIISALVFNTLTSSIGTPAVLWIFFACSITGAGFTLLLPEVAGRDPDAILAEELREKRLQQRR